MDDFDWDKLAAQEEEWEQGGESDAFLTAYNENEYDLVQSDGEGQEFDYGGDDDDQEFNQFVDQDPFEYGFSYAQLEHVSYGDLEMGTTIGGKFSKLEKILQMQTVSKEKLYTNKLKFELNNYFNFKKTNHYAAVIQSVPRFWLKNAPALAGTIFMIDKLEGSKLTVQKLADFSAQTNVRKEDLYRYYRLLEKYIM